MNKILNKIQNYHLKYDLTQNQKDLILIAYDQELLTEQNTFTILDILLNETLLKQYFIDYNHNELDLGYIATDPTILEKFINQYYEQYEVIQ